MDIDDVWPVSALRLRTPRLELRIVRDDDLPALVEAALAGVHDPARMPFSSPWTDEAPAELARSFARFQWQRRTAVRPDSWSLSLAVLSDGVPIGVQDIEARDLSRLRTVSSGSWLTASAQGQGFGTEMRAALLLFAFDHLGAEWAESTAYTRNAASLAVSRRLGCVPNGIGLRDPRPGEVVDEQRMRLHRGDFVRPEWMLRIDGASRALPELLIRTGTDAAPEDGRPA